MCSAELVSVGCGAPRVTEWESHSQVSTKGSTGLHPDPLCSLCGRLPCSYQEPHRHYFLTVCRRALEMLSPFGYDILALVGKTSQGIRTLIKAKPENKVWPGPTKARVIALPSPTKKQIIELFILTNFVKEAKQSMTNKKNRMRQSLKGRTLRHFTLSTGKSAGRNSSGRITVFHRGGGSKRLQRKIYLKRSTSSIGIVERIEYDPNRSSRIALVRWIEGVLPGRQRKFKTIEEFAPPRKILESTTATIFCLFSFSSPPGKVDQRKVACSRGKCLLTLYVVVGLPTFMPLEASTKLCFR